MLLLQSSHHILVLLDSLASNFHLKLKKKKINFTKFAYFFFHIKDLQEHNEYNPKKKKRKDIYQSISSETEITTHFLLHFTHSIFLIKSSGSKIYVAISMQKKKRKRNCFLWFIFKMPKMFPSWEQFKDKQGTKKSSPFLQKTVRDRQDMKLVHKQFQWDLPMQTDWMFCLWLVMWCCLREVSDINHAEKQSSPIKIQQIWKIITFSKF